ncbi:MAG: hypothetical protein AVDCRST_MAG08-318 [uncultured Acetobacteraceae bacterium]|uniref:Uncharacterized protein n=1 Tax=uncultured Acetobacteraceae bacterium TaxID=169975 RepID=A0A6J4H7F9_9PROT|nr:MAG: hypothetical protein AVDCRST_MAG08-318 [uncultured Acetobacteraceae bacterium]
MLPSASWTGSWSSETLSFTSSPVTTAMRSSGKPSRTASAATTRAAAGGLAAPKLPRTGMRCAWQSASTGSNRRSSIGS